ncbi:MAG TPA: DUF1634 domain-containing protein [Steroidobacteraceae bacterium]|nr:DUF1634 domain-containing protein [Steroidobacteraceae bacterium]
MSGELALPASLEQVLGRLLHYGTHVASAVIALGLLLAFGSGGAGMRIATIGIVLFILLPVARVAAMLLFFWRARDYRFAAIAALVLLIIAFSYVVGSR